MTLQEYAARYVALITDLATATGIGPSVELRELLADAAKDGFGTFQVAQAAHDYRVKAGHPLEMDA